MTHGTFFAESVVRFNQTPTCLCAFPTSRIDRKGRCDGRQFGHVLRERRQKIIEENVELVMYDLVPLPADTSVVPVHTILAEIYEHDAPDTFARLSDFARLSGAKSTISFASSMDHARFIEFREAGYRVMAIRDFDYASLLPVPTVVGISRAAPLNVVYESRSIDTQDEVAVALMKAHVLLTQSLTACGKEEAPRFLGAAWRTLDTLSAVPAPLTAFEHARRELHRPSLRAEIERHRTPRIFHGEERVGEIVFAGWTNVVNALARIYDLLERRNPLAEMVLERIVDGSGAFAVAVSDKAARDALIGELLIGYGWRSDDAVIDTAANLSRARNVHRRVVTVGVDGTRRKDASLWALLPERVEALMYPHSVRRHRRWLDRIQTDSSIAIPDSTLNTARVFWGEHAVKDVDRAMGAITILVAVPDLSEIRVRLEEEARRSWESFEAVGVTRPTADRDEDLLFDDPDDVPSDVDDTLADGEALQVSFSTGETLAFAYGAEVLVIDGEDVERRAVHLLEPGDEILFLPEERHRSAFETIRHRTTHLVNADERVMERWRQALSVLRYQYPPADSAACQAFAERVRSEDCKKGSDAIISWLRGVHMAPRDQEDVEILLKISGVGVGAELLAREIHGQIMAIRTFCRSLGHRFQRRLEGKMLPPDDPITGAIDDFLDEAEHRRVSGIKSPD